MTALSILGAVCTQTLSLQVLLQLSPFSSLALGKINKFLLRSFIRQFAGSSSVKFLFLLCARQNKQVSFALAYASVPAHATDDGSRGIGQVMCKWVNGSFTYTHNECSHYSPKATTLVIGAPRRQGCATLLRYRSWYRWCIEQVKYVIPERK